jgi:hypothetical protein
MGGPGSISLWIEWIDSTSFNPSNQPSFLTGSINQSKTLKHQPPDYWPRCYTSSSSLTGEFFNMSQQNAFDYATMGTIHEEGHAFRLLRLLSGRGPEICCELVKAYLSDLSHAMPYAALSYAWGDTKMSESIILNGKSHLVTPNLYHALENLRWENEDRILWVDSICINQKEHKEKNHQLVYMATIYREAERVIFWLGPSTYETDLLMSALNSLQRQTYKVACSNWKIHDT